MTIILKANKVNVFVSSVWFVFWYHSPNILDTPRVMHDLIRANISVAKRSIHYVCRYISYTAIITSKTSLNHCGDSEVIGFRCLPKLPRARVYVEPFHFSQSSPSCTQTHHFVPATLH
jgi:hypothetical protein